MLGIPRATLIVILSLLPSLMAMTQTNRDFRELNQLGDEYFNQEQFYKATDYYKQAVEIEDQNSYSLFQLAQCYRLLFAFENAESHYQQVKDADKTSFSLAHYYHPLMQKLNGKYEEAIKGFEAFIKLSVGIDTAQIPQKPMWVEQAWVEKEGCIFALQQQLVDRSELNFSRLPFPVNSEFNDYAPNFYQNDSTLVFTSGRIGAEGFSVDNRYGEGFTDNFRYKKGKRKWDYLKSKDKFEVTNSKWNDGAGVFNASYDKYYFTRCGNDDNSGCRIYVSILEGNSWQSPKPLSEVINLPEYDSKQPAINYHGDTLFFISNRPGGYGQNDIWMSALSVDEKWQEPINLGSKINTLYNEISPFYHNESGFLFFASNGHQSIGGLDIYMLTGNIFNQPDVVNMGLPINSNADDGYLVLGKSSGYMASNRTGGQGKFDIYSFEIDNLNDFINNKLFISGRGWVINSKLNTMYQSGLYAVREEDQLYYENISHDDKNEFSMVLASKLADNDLFSNSYLTEADEFYFRNLPHVYKEMILKMKESDRAAFKISGMDDDPEQDTFKAVAKLNYLPDDHTNRTIINGQLHHKNTSAPLGNLVISVVNANNVIIKTTNTNEDGTFEFTDVRGNGPYKIVLTQLNDKKTIADKFEVHNLSIYQYDPEKININFENVYFDFAADSIKSHSKPLLDEMADYLKSDPKLKVELFSYTDSVGTASLNIELSKKRGIAVINYLKTKGVNSNALVVRALGEYFEDNNFTFYDSLLAQYSRRVEFSINSGTKSFKPSYMTIITKKADNIEAIADLLGISVEELYTLNGLQPNQVVEAYYPLTIPATARVDSSIGFSIDMEP